MRQDIDKLINSYKLISDQISRESLHVVLESLNAVIDDYIEGDIVELGCYRGTTSLFIERLLKVQDQRFRSFHVYDSFEGLPEKSPEDKGVLGEHFKKGELQVSKKDFIGQFKKAGLKSPIIHKAWFNELTKNDIPNKIAFAFLDGDFYQSILTSLKLTWPKLSKGGIVCIDDYKREALPGVEKAIINYFGSDEMVIKRANIGIIKKVG